MKERLIKSATIPKCCLWTGSNFNSCRLNIEKISEEEKVRTGCGSELLFFSCRENENLFYLSLNNERFVLNYERFNWLCHFKIFIPLSNI